MGIDIPVGVDLSQKCLGHLAIFTALFAPFFLTIADIFCLSSLPQQSYFFKTYISNNHIGWTVKTSSLLRAALLLVVVSDSQQMRPS